jgi:hypothetical protein
MSPHTRSIDRANVNNKKKRAETDDEIQSILGHAGIFAPRLERMRVVALEMREMEWKMIKRAAASRFLGAAPSNRSRD